MIKLSVARDPQEIQDFLYPSYFDESGFNHLTYDPDATRYLIDLWLREYAVVARDNGRVIGFAVMALQNTFYKELEGEVDMFYVLPEYRGTGVSRQLVDAMVQIAEMNGAAVIYTSCLSAVSDQNNVLYENLWKKYGFKKLGSTMYRSK